MIMRVGRDLAFFLKMLLSPLWKEGMILNSHGLRKETQGSE
jgi:hypothetical protein